MPQDSLNHGTLLRHASTPRPLTLGGDDKMAARAIGAARRLVVKIGSDLVVDWNTGSTRQAWLATLVRDIARLRRLRCDVVLVSSGAVAMGRHMLGLHGEKLRVRERQAAAAAGQMSITRAYTELFAWEGLSAAQVLLTPDDTALRHRSRNLRAMLTQLLSNGAIPIVNENDAVTTSATGFGDNDRLAARIAQIIVADVLVVLSNIDGLYTSDPMRSASATPIREVHEITSEIERMAGGSSSCYGSGGMTTKIAAARMAFAIGCAMVIADGRNAQPLSRIDNGEPCTWFLPPQAARIARKAAIASSFAPSGDLVVHLTAAEEIRRGRNLDVTGIRGFVGHFARGNVVAVRDLDGKEIARGLALCSSFELKEARRLTAAETGVAPIDLARNLIVHSDDIVLTE
ncbi:MAG TPA: glutamate 5-kinase [Steroidobacteraceae bacterium]|jgi:glutamate 5-kinase|nr:glutamate 5-kinase [Steroidobacteraceae bacterium]